MSFDARALKHLLPIAEAFKLSVVKPLGDWIEGVSVAWRDVRTFVDRTWLDLFAGETRLLTEWEDHFQLLPAVLTEPARRLRLSARKQAQGGQSPRYIQDTLQARGFDVFVHEWWSDLVPTVRDPNDFLSQAGAVFAPQLAETTPPMQLGEATFQLGEVTSGVLGYPLTNKLRVVNIVRPGAGDPLMQAGEDIAQAGEILELNYTEPTPAVPSDPAVWPFFVYIGGETFPEIAYVSFPRRDEFEALVLQLIPQHLWAGILVKYA